MVFFSTINRNPKSYLHLIVGAEYLLKFVPKGTHDWKKFITPAELARMCRQAGIGYRRQQGHDLQFVERPLFFVRLDRGQLHGGLPSGVRVQG